MNKYEALLSPVQVGPITLKNRVVMPPMANNLCNADGTLSEASIAHYTERARGGVGLIIVECSAVDFPHGLIVARQPAVNSMNYLPDWRRLSESVHAYGAKIICQIHHGGFLADPTFNNGEICLSPSGYDGDLWYPAREMSHDEVLEMIQKHISAAQMLHAAGFDGVEVHCSSTYLINEFLTPEYNHRTDEFGGSLENRARILTDIIKGIKETCPDFMVSCRLAIEDVEIDNGLSMEDGVAIAKLCEQAGADMINCTIGFFQAQWRDTAGQWMDEGDRLYMAVPTKPAMTTAKVAAVGKFRSPEFCNEVIEEGKADLVCIGRQLLCDPHFVRKLERGLDDMIRPCLNCNDGCVNEALYNNGSVRCAINPYTGYEHRWNEYAVAEAGKDKKVMIIGGGIAGMQAAIIAAKRGHDVTLFEASENLGGQMDPAGGVKHKSVIRRAMNWFIKEVNSLDIDVRLGEKVDADKIRAFAPDTVVVAVGADPAIPPIPGTDRAVFATDVLSHFEICDNCTSATVIGGASVGCEAALHLADQGLKVTLLEMLPEIGLGEDDMHREYMLGQLEDAVDIYTEATVKAIADSVVGFATKEGVEKTAPADLTVLACGFRSAGQELYEASLAEGIETFRIGDSASVGNLRAATRAAMDVAYRI